ncbi:MAG: 4-(cytidine 5'-diphospho)-2-C-methyl-D-erythritol kinase [Emergencia sp.]
MKEIRIQSFAKINLSIDVTGVTENGMHLVDMVMHQLSFHDDVAVRYIPEKGRKPGDFEIAVQTNRYYLPVDERNLAWKAAALMAQRFGAGLAGGRIETDIFKRIPVAAGLAGGSSNGAAVLHGLNLLWNLRLDLQQLCSLGAELGSDVPFCVMGQAGYNFDFPRKLRKDPLASACARALGTGTELEPLCAVRKPVVIAKPPVGVSTREVYAGIDRCSIKQRPDNDLLSRGLSEKKNDLIYSNCINVLENYTLQAYPQVAELKEQFAQCSNPEKVLMSGSGPTVFAIYRSISDAKAACAVLRQKGYEAYWTKTTK